ncbi:hypothetical protein EVG20_g11088 [Dentipellis fragilis]|uniref:Uncharacterized protein n=1 Tax=Dentipellis fragilis TaxID=205917 RepID=A0A4Y9XME1_9AGAM|nr:hypothetical protein EVG20_g11088 [Dentipellis fragilis]
MEDSHRTRKLHEPVHYAQSTTMTAGRTVVRSGIAIQIRITATGTRSHGSRTAQSYACAAVPANNGRLRSIDPRPRSYIDVPSQPEYPSHAPPHASRQYHSRIQCRVAGHVNPRCILCSLEAHRDHDTVHDRTRTQPPCQYRVRIIADASGRCRCPWPWSPSLPPPPALPNLRLRRVFHFSVSISASIFPIENPKFQQPEPRTECDDMLFAFCFGSLRRVRTYVSASRVPIPDSRVNSDAGNGMPHAHLSSGTGTTNRRRSPARRHHVSMTMTTQQHNTTAQISLSPALSEPLRIAVLRRPGTSAVSLAAAHAHLLLGFALSPDPAFRLPSPSPSGLLYPSESLRSESPRHCQPALVPYYTVYLTLLRPAPRVPLGPRQQTRLSMSIRSPRWRLCSTFMLMLEPSFLMLDA